MNIYDKAHEFAKDLKDCDEVVHFREASKKIQMDEQNKKMLNDLRDVQFQAYSEQMQQGKISEATKQKLEGLGSIVSMNPIINEYLQAEYRFGLLWEDIMKIFDDAIGIESNFMKNK